ncbi:hypothetical protein F5H01DRAFT_204391 [Linnemannia elongata]|nr:hypothetical protein F5H01DRAFT_204391 [Linnemannia elongata]
MKKGCFFFFFLSAWTTGTTITTTTTSKKGRRQGNKDKRERERERERESTDNVFFKRLSVIQYATTLIRYPHLCLVPCGIAIDRCKHRTHTQGLRLLLPLFYE